MKRLYDYTRSHCMHCQPSFTLTSLWGWALHAEALERRWWTEGSTSGPDDPNINKWLGDICTGTLILPLTPLFSLKENNTSGVFTASSVFVPSGIGMHLPSVPLHFQMAGWWLDDDFKPKFHERDECLRWPCIFEGGRNKKLSKEEPEEWWKGRKWCWSWLNGCPLHALPTNTHSILQNWTSSHLLSLPPFLCTVHFCTSSALLSSVLLHPSPLKCNLTSTTGFVQID